MARESVPQKTGASLSVGQARVAMPKVKRRLDELSALDVNRLDNESGGHVSDSYVQKINATLREIYEVGSVEYDEYSISTLRPNFAVWYSGLDISLRGNLDTVRSNVRGAVTKLKTLFDILEEQSGIDPEDLASRAIRAYNGLELHPEISRASSRLYLDGHVENAVESAVKALNGLVRLRSGLEFDGTTLMERAFNPTNPVLKFNDLKDASDKDEQKGFMQMFAGAVSGLRNPRAHRFIHDDPERALEFIAYVSLLAKLLDESKK